MSCTGSYTNSQIRSASDLDAAIVTGSGIRLSEAIAKFKEYLNICSKQMFVRISINSHTFMFSTYYSAAPYFMKHQNRMRPGVVRVAYPAQSEI